MNKLIKLFTGFALAAVIFVGCKDENTAPEIGALNPATDTTMHVGNEILFVANVTSSMAFEYKWFVNNEPKGKETTYLFTPTVSGEYTIKVLVSNKYGADSTEAIINVFPKIFTIDFEELTLGTQGYWNGSDDTGKFKSGAASFVNNFNSSYQSWSGFSYTNLSDTITKGYDNMYSVFNSKNLKNQFSVYYYSSYSPSFIDFESEKPLEVLSIDLCNTTYPALSMLNGDSFSKKFGGDTGNDPDFLKVIISGMDKNNNNTGTVEFYLADYRNSDNTKDYIVKDWTSVDLSALGKVSKLYFTIQSSDNGTWGMNTPAYFALDNIRYYDPE